MNILFDAVLAFLSSAGILLILWTVSGLLLPDRAAVVRSVTAVCAAREGGVPPAEAARAVTFFSAASGVPITLVIVDAGLLPQSRREAELLCYRKGFTLCGEADLSETILRPPAKRDISPRGIRGIE